MLRVLKSFIVLFLLPLLLAGCANTDTENLKKNIEISNRKIDAIVSDYNTSKFKATELFDEILSYLNSEASDITSKGLSKDYLEGVTGVLDGYIIDITASYEDLKVFNEDRGTDVMSFSDFIVDISKCYYFLNEEDGTLEQDILFRLPYGVMLGVEITWLGGDVIEIETYTNS